MQEELTLSVQGEKQPRQDGHMQEGPAMIRPHDGNTQITSCHLPVAVNSSGKCSSVHSIFWLSETEMLMLRLALFNYILASSFYSQLAPFLPLCLSSLK